MKKTPIVTFLTIYICFSNKADSIYQQFHNYTMTMPNVRPDKPNKYLCTPVEIDVSKSYYIIGYEPEASMNTVHHMILYGCETPGSSSKIVWDCGEMGGSNEGESYPPCGKKTSILYAWARNAPKLDLPLGVAFKAGKETSIKYFVLQVHYANVDKFLREDTFDTSGLTIKYVETPLPRSAGVLLLGTMGQIPSRSLESMETTCKIREDIVIHPFAYRVHTHELGVRVVGYRVRIINNTEYWTKIGEKDPLLPQMFYPIDEKVPIRKNDILAASCKVDATRRNRITFVGATGEDEMCNFYMMYWKDDSRPLKRQFCFSMGPPHYYWEQDVSNIPAIERQPYYKTRN